MPELVEFPEQSAVAYHRKVAKPGLPGAKTQRGHGLLQPVHEPDFLLHLVVPSYFTEEHAQVASGSPQRLGVSIFVAFTSEAPSWLAPSPPPLLRTFEMDASALAAMDAAHDAVASRQAAQDNLDRQARRRVRR